MLRIVRLLISLALLAAFVWFGATVKLGERTLFGHLYAIGQTKESQDLVKGTKETAQPIVDDVRRRFGSGDGGTAHAAAVPDAGAPEESLTETDRKALRKVLGKAAREAAKQH